MALTKCRVGEVIWEAGISLADGRAYVAWYSIVTWGLEGVTLRDADGRDLRYLDIGHHDFHDTVKEALASLRASLQSRVHSLELQLESARRNLQSAENPRLPRIAPPDEAQIREARDAHERERREALKAHLRQRLAELEKE